MQHPPNDHANATGHERPPGGIGQFGARLQPRDAEREGGDERQDERHRRGTDNVARTVVERSAHGSAGACGPAIRRAVERGVRPASRC